MLEMFCLDQWMWATEVGRLVGYIELALDLSKLDGQFNVDEFF